MNRIVTSFCLSLALACSAAVAQPVPFLAVDVDRRTPGAEDNNPLNPLTANTVAGYQSLTMPVGDANQTSFTAMVGGYTITMNSVQADGTPGGVITDRDRTTPLDTPALAQLYDDFIFAGQANFVGGSIDLIIDSDEALEGNTSYFFSVYSFDVASSALPQPRTSDWLDGNQGDSVVLSTAFSGGATNLPTTDDQYKFTGVVQTDAMGNLLLKARNTTPLSPTGAFQPGVLINGFEISQIPEPSTLALAALVLGIAAWQRRRGQ